MSDLEQSLDPATAYSVKLACQLSPIVTFDCDLSLQWRASNQMVELLQLSSTRKIPLIDSASPLVRLGLWRPHNLPNAPSLVQRPASPTPSLRKYSTLVGWPVGVPGRVAGG